MARSAKETRDASQQFFPHSVMYGQDRRTRSVVFARICMPRSIPTRDDRLELRTTKEEKRLLAAAAAFERPGVTAFIMRQVLPAARDAVERNERIVLSDRDTTLVLELLENPPRPTAALLDAARLP